MVNCGHHAHLIIDFLHLRPIVQLLRRTADLANNAVTQPKLTVSESRHSFRLGECRLSSSLTGAALKQRTSAGPNFGSTSPIKFAIS